jgi:hypothetical protein
LSCQWTDCDGDHLEAKLTSVELRYVKCDDKITWLVGVAASTKSDIVVGKPGVIKTLVEVDFARVAASKVVLSIYMVPPDLMRMPKRGSNKRDGDREG